MNSKGKFKVCLSLTAAVGLVAFPVWACNPGPGPGKGTPATLKEGPETAKFDHGQEQSKVQLELLDRPLKKIAEKCGQKELEILSGYRNPSYNAGVGGAKGSQHMCGNAADIHFCKGKSLAQMFKFLAEAGCGGIGCYSTFVQCDIGPKRQWGPCPGSRPPADDPKDDNKDSKQQPDSAYDSKTPSEIPTLGGIPSNPSAGGSSPSTVNPPATPEQAQYPTARDNSSPSSRGNVGDLREPLDPSSAGGRGPGKVPAQDPNTITKQSETGLPSFSGSSGGAGRAVPLDDYASSAGSGRSSTAASGKVAGGGGALAKSAGNKPDGETGDSAPRAPVASTAGGGSSGGTGSESISPFSGDKGLGAAKVAMGGNASELDADIKKIQDNEFGGARDPAGTDSATLFERCHGAYERCLRGGCVTSRGSR